MTTGRFIAVVGPSGVGKDSVMQGIAAAVPTIHLVHRTITRAPGLGGEDYASVTPQRFDDMVKSGAFALHWDAHGLSYGVPNSVTAQLQNGQDCLANLSRTALQAGADTFAPFAVLNITARPETLARRLAVRGRETPAEIVQRLAQAEKPLPRHLNILHLANDGPLDDTVARAVTLLHPRETPRTAHAERFR